MIAYYDPAVEHLDAFKVFRVHPWESGDGFTYCDFKAHPERIEETIEDMVPHRDQPAVQRYYEFLRWINGPESILETNDTAFRRPTTNRNRKFPFKFVAVGRTLVLYRRPELNIYKPFVELRRSAYLRALAAYEPEFRAGEVRLGDWVTGFLALADDENPNGRGGLILDLEFSAFGDSAGETWSNLDRVFGGIFAASREVSARAAALLASVGEPPPLGSPSGG